MSEIRQDPTTKVWVIIAPERAKRPQQEVKKRRDGDFPEWDKDCPFCPGNENKTPLETFRLPASAPSQPWKVRVVPNQFAAVTAEENTSRIEDGPLFRKMGGYGLHEVIIESPSHNTTIALMPYEQVERVLIAYQDRYNTLKKDPAIQSITIFKNHGQKAGISLIHPHSQLVATPILAPHYNRKFDIAHEYYADTGRCLYCDLIDWDLKNTERVIGETRNFSVIQPYAPHVPYETWIMPKTHCASFGLFPATHLAELARVLKDVLFCLHEELDNPAFNYMIDSTTTTDEESPFYHWHLRIVPRITTIAGFEMGSGMYVNTTLPEDTAQIMKKRMNELHEKEEISITPTI